MIRASPHVRPYFFFESIAVMGNQLAPTTFATSAEEQLAAQDAYTVESGEVVVNARKDVNDTLSIQGLKGLLGGNLGGTKLFSLTSKGIQLNTDSLLKGIIQANPGLNSAISQVSAGVKAGLTAVAGVSKVMASVNGIVSTIRNTNLSDLRSVGNMIGSLTNAPYALNLVDVAGMSNFTANLVNQADTMGLRNVFQTVNAGINDVNIMNNVVRNLTPGIIARGSVNLLNDVVSEGYGPILLAERPDIIAAHGENWRTPPHEGGYKLPGDDTIYTSVSYYTLDPDWSAVKGLWTKNPGDAPSLDMNRGLGVSDDLEQNLQQNANYATPVVPVGPGTDYSTLDTSLKTQAALPDLKYEPQLAQIQAVTSAMPAKELQTAQDPVASMAQSFPNIPRPLTKAEEAERQAVIDQENQQGYRGGLAIFRKD